jgi:DNA-binding beta-propeller fold protein YncE
VKRSLVTTFLITGLAGMLSAQPTYTISTVAGSATNSLGDGGNAAGATVLSPVSVVADAAGNIYIADAIGVSVATASPFGTGSTGQGRIRKIDATSHNISTLTTVTSDPKAISLDAAGKFLYVADNGNHRIRKVDTTTGATTTFAGTGSADPSNYGRLATQVRIRNPRGVWVDANGNVYLTDTQNSRVARVDAVTGIMSLVAGRGTNNSSQATTSSALAAPGGDGGPAIQGQLWSPEAVVGDNNGNLYIADTGSNRIRKVVLSCTGQPAPCTVGTISTVVGLGTSGVADNVDASLAQLNQPRGLAMDATGANLYIADSGNNRIRKWTVATCSTTVNGVLVNPSAGCNQVNTVAGSGSPKTGVGDGTPALVASLSNPTGVFLDAAGNMYIADQNDSRVRFVDVTNGLISTITGASQGRGDSGPASLATFNNPRGVAVDSAGNIYIGDTFNQKIRKVSAAGIVTTFAGNGAAGNVNMAAAPIYNIVNSFSPALATATPLNFPGCVAVDSGNNVLIADRVNSKIRRVDTTGAMTNYVSSNTASVNKTGVVSVGALATGYNGDGGLAVGDKVSLPTNAGFLSAGSSSGANANNGPQCVTVDNNENVYIADTGNNVIRKVDPSGVLSTVVGYQTVLCGGFVCSSPNAPPNVTPVVSGIAGLEGDGGLAANAQLNAPQGVAVDPSGSFLCIADTGNNTVRQVNLSTGIIITIAGIMGDGGSDALPANGWQSRNSGPQGCAMDAALNTYIADTGNNRILIVTPAGQMSIIAGGGSTFGGDGKAATAAIVNAPTGIAVDSATPANVYFTDRFGLVRKITPNPK